jgi:hypothetical protein
MHASDEEFSSGADLPYGIDRRACLRTSTGFSGIYGRVTCLRHRLARNIVHVMNEYRSSGELLETGLLPRLAYRTLANALDAVPVAVIMGARQTGKSTLAKMHGAGRPYLTLDDFDTFEQARTSPLDLVLRYPIMTLDEVQREPDLLLAIKRAVDEQRPRRRGVSSSRDQLTCC